MPQTRILSYTVILTQLIFLMTRGSRYRKYREFVEQAHQEISEPTLTEEQQQDVEVKEVVTDTQSGYMRTDQWEKENRLPKPVSPPLDSTDPMNERALVEQYLKQNPNPERTADKISPKFQGRIEVSTKSATHPTAQPESTASAKPVAPKAQNAPQSTQVQMKDPVIQSNAGSVAAPRNPTASRSGVQLPEGVVKTHGLVNLSKSKVVPRNDAASTNAQTATTTKPNSQNLSTNASIVRAKQQPLSQGGSNANVNGVPNGAASIVRNAGAQKGRVAQIASQFGGSVNSANDNEKRRAKRTDE